MARKDIERDTKAGAALTAWMKANEMSQGALAKVVGRSASAVATWQHGTRPMVKERKLLAELTGWEWDSPPGEDYVPTVKATPTPATTTRRKPRASRPAVDVSGIETNSMEALIVARSRLADVASGSGTLNPTRAADKLALDTVTGLLDAEITRREATDKEYQKLSAIRTMVLGHKNPAEALAFLRNTTNTSRKLLDAVERTLALENGASAAA